MILIALLIVIVFAVFGAPLFLILGAAALLGYLSSGQDLMLFFASNFVQVSTNPIFLAIPLFTLAGFLLSESGAPTRLVNLTKAFFGWMPGGLAIVSLFACAFFTAFTGASGVTIIALGGLLYPIIIKEGYPEKFTLGLMTTSGSRGLLFPPSLPLIIYAMIAGLSLQGIEEFKVQSVKDEVKAEAAVDAEDSAGDKPAEKKQSDEDLLKEFDIDVEKTAKDADEKSKAAGTGEGAGSESAASGEERKMHQISVDNLFVAGAVPGFLMILMVGAYSIIFARKSKVKRTEFDFRYVLKALRDALWEIPVPVIIIVGIYGGFFTAIDAAAITAFYVFVVEVFVYRDIRINRLPAIFRESMILVGGILLILLSALSLTNFFI
ncbi:MAG: TRAP transporter large permease subunit, partial [Deltaproteobacteria bacterium]|nr:TRAP transporter large permease subunit [Deltaproteobacteria bacterium]